MKQHRGWKYHPPIHKHEDYLPRGECNRWLTRYVCDTCGSSVFFLVSASAGHSMPWSMRAECTECKGWALWERDGRKKIKDGNDVPDRVGELLDI